MKKILFINTAYNHKNISGSYRRYWELINSLAENNEVVLCTQYIPGDIKKDRVQCISPLECDELLNAKEMYKFSVACRKIVRSIDYDVCVSFSAMQTIYCKIAGAKRIVAAFREDIVLYSKIVYENNFKSKLKLWFKSFVERKAVKCADKIIVQCEDDKIALENRYPLLKSKANVYIQINNINTSWNKEIRHKNELSNSVRVAFVTNFIEKPVNGSKSRKGNDLLFAAISELEQEGMAVELNVYGAGGNFEWYKEQYAYVKSIRFKGFEKDPSVVYQNVDFSVVPSLADSCPNTVLESLRNFVPVYGTNVGGIKDMLQNNKQYLFEPDVDELVSFLRKKIIDKEYLSDVEMQEMDIVPMLTFDWGKKMEQIINSR